MTEIEDLSLFLVAASRAAEISLGEACASVLGCGLPDANRFREGALEGRPCLLAFAGHRQWLVAGRGLAAPTALADHGWLTDLSDGWVGAELKGDATGSVLEKLCPLDLHPSQFSIGASVRTLLEGMHCHLLCRDPVTWRIDLLFQRSSAGSLMRHLRHAAMSACGGRD